MFVDPKKKSILLKCYIIPLHNLGFVEQTDRSTIENGWLERR